MDLSVFPKSTKLQTIRRFVLKKENILKAAHFAPEGSQAAALGSAWGCISTVVVIITKCKISSCFFL